MDGYIIANKDWTDSLALDLAHHTFGATMIDAWMRHIGGSKDRADAATIINRWAQKGWCARPCKITVSAPEGTK